MNVQNESMYFNEIHFVLLGNVSPPHLYHNYWAQKHYFTKPSQKAMHIR